MTKREKAIRKLILELLPRDGQAITNRAVLVALQADLSDVSKEEYLQVREKLLVEGHLLKAPGRGGSVRCASAGAPAQGEEPIARPRRSKIAPLADTTSNEENEASAYQHEAEAIQRPEVGLEAQFSHRKPPQAYRYDSSLAPELSWDENPDRAFAEWLISLIVEAASNGKETFSRQQIWREEGGRTLEVRSLRECASLLRSITKPFLNWAGKAERSQLHVPTLPLFVHERHSTKAILETLTAHKSHRPIHNLFGDPDLDIADKLDAYEFKGPWTNRLILGDSLRVMNSLLEYEGMGSQAQMIYFDPPYGVKYGSNFQPFVRKRDTKEGSDDHITREPEMVKAYRDTWELGLHSYMTYLRDRLMLAREMLADSGSIFVQISDENVHHVREILDEVFGAENFLTTIVFRKKGATQVTHSVNDFILWSAKNKRIFAPRQLYYKRPDPEDYGKYKTLISPEGEKKSTAHMDKVEVQDLTRKGWRWARTNYGIVSQHYSAKRSQPYHFDGKDRVCGPNMQWRYEVPAGLDRLAKAGRLHAGKGKSMTGIVYWDEWPYVSYHNVWTDVQGAHRPIYAVQTSDKVVERCLLMATDPGDLVLDISCGSGTTPVVAERWGRRWITCDTSRVPIALARQRLLTGRFDWYRLKDPGKGPAGGFVYARKRNRQGEEIGGLIPRKTLKSIANDEEPEMVTLVQTPEEEEKITRVCGPFTVEATVRAAESMEENGSDAMPISSPRAYLDRMIEILRQNMTLRLPKNAVLALDTVRPLADLEYLHAECIAKQGDSDMIAIAFGAEDAEIGSEFVFHAAQEAMQNGYQQLFLFGFAIQAKARDLLHKQRVPQITYISVTPDVNMSDLLKTNRTSEIFSVTGLPDVRLVKDEPKPDGTPQYRVVVRGLDVFLPASMETEAIEAENLPCWMLDTDYNGMVFYASQVFFPKTSAWQSIRDSLGWNYDDSVWDHLAGTTSAPFTLGERKRIAVKVIDDRGNELMAVRAEDEVL